MRKFLHFFAVAENKIFIVIVLTTLATATAIFAIMSNMLFTSIAEDLYTRMENVNLYADSTLPLESFSELNSPADEANPIYRSAQSDLDKIRRIANVRYLFTAKRSSDNKLVYVIDALPPDNADFRHIGDPIEDEIISKLTRCMNGEIVNTNSILQTSWGPIMLTCWPKRDASGTVVGLIVMEYDAEPILAHYEKTRIYSLVIALAIACIFIVIAYFLLSKISESFYKKLAHTDVMTGLSNRLSFERCITQLKCASITQPVCVVIYDLNYLKFQNDTYGHAIGDKYIQKMGKALLEMPRGENTTKHFRIGGDEFATITQGITMDNLEACVKQQHEKYKSLIKNEDFFDFAYGIACYMPNSTVSIDEIIQQADQRMYAFKQIHRDEAIQKS